LTSVPGAWEAGIKLVYAVDAGRCSAIDTIAHGAAFDVLANVTIGQNLMQVVDSYDLFVSVRDLSRSSTLLSRRKCVQLAPQRAPLKQTLQLSFDPGWEASEGDVLDVMATFKVTAGINTVYSSAGSNNIIVTS
jgi:hypothetical protein